MASADPYSGERAAIARVDRPLTETDIKSRLAACGVMPGDVVLMHTSLSRLGWVVGAAQTVLQAVTDYLGPDGTLVTPGFSGQLSDPATWSRPAVPAEWVETVRAGMPLFDPAKTATRGIGKLPEHFRSWPGTKRSHHPTASFLANGPMANDILADHGLDYPLGPTSPLGKLHDMNAKVLLLGAGYDSCTCFHLAEHDLPGTKTEHCLIPTHREGGATQWTQTSEPEMFEDHFETIGATLDAVPGAVTIGFDGAARCFHIVDAVACAKTWFSKQDMSKLSQST